MSNKISEEDKSEFLNYVQAGNIRKIIEYLEKYIEYKPNLDDLSRDCVNYMCNYSMVKLETKDLDAILKSFLVLFADHNCEKLSNEINQRDSHTQGILNERVWVCNNESKKIKDQLVEAIKSGSLENSVKLLTEYPGLLAVSRDRISCMIGINYGEKMDLLADAMKEPEANNGNHEASESETKDNVKMHKLEQAHLDLLNETLDDLDISHVSGELKK